MAEFGVKVKLGAEDKASAVINKVGATLKTAVVAGAAAAAAAMAALTFELVKATQAANVQEEAEVKLSVALRSVGKASRETLDGLKAHASALQNVTKFGDETIIGVQALLVQLGRLADTEQIERATEATLQFAAATGTDLQAAALLVAKAAQGQTASLSRYGLILREGIPPQEKFTELLSLMEKNFGGTAEALGATFQGRLQQSRNAFGDMQEQIGFTITQSEAMQEILRTLTRAFEKAGEFVADNRDELVSFVKDGILIAVEGIEIFFKASQKIAEGAGLVTQTVVETTGDISGFIGTALEFYGLGGKAALEYAEVSKDAADGIAEDQEKISSFFGRLIQKSQNLGDRIAATSDDARDATDSLLGLGEGAEMSADSFDSLLQTLDLLGMIVPAIPGPSKEDIEQTAKALDAQKSAIQEIEKLTFEASGMKRELLERELEDQLEQFEKQLEFEGTSVEERLALKEFEAQRRKEIDAEVDEHSRQLALENLNFGQELALESVETLTEGLATFVEHAILNAENLKEVGEGVIKSLVGSVVGGLAKMASQFLVNAILHKIAKKQEGASALSANLAAVFSGAFASTAAIPIVGPTLAPAVAAASLAAATAGSTAAAAAGAGLGAGIVAQEGGFVPMLPGANRERDSILAMLIPGELVVPTPFAQEFGRAQGFQDGGVVGGEAAAPPAGGAMQVALNFIGVDPAQMVEIADALSESVERFGARLVSSEVAA